jgi:hypothetical protein
MATRLEVVEFLNLFKGCIMMGRISIKDRPKNRQGLIDLGIAADERREVLLGLGAEDYSAGPKPDDTDDTKEVWEFAKEVNGRQAYMKLRVVQAPGKRGVFHGLVWSFHPAEHPAKHPLRGGGT